MRSFLSMLLLSVPAGLLLAGTCQAGPTLTHDLATISTQDGGLLRLHGSEGKGDRGLPVAGSHDCDGDGSPDFAMAAMTASPLGRAGAGQVYLVFGDRSVSGTFDSDGFDADILKIYGAGLSEAAGSEIWMDDVTGDGLGDLLIARQNFTPDPNRPGAGALTIVVGSSELRSQAGALSPLDLASPPPALKLFTLIGARGHDRLGIWMRTGDVTGDGIPDILVAADQESSPGEHHRGAAYVIRGGAHLAAGGEIDLADFGSELLGGNLMKLSPPEGSAEFHLGATCQVADLDGNERAEVMLAAALNRCGAGIQPAGGTSTNHSLGGSDDGTLFIAWDDCFTPWNPGATIELSGTGCDHTRIDGGTANRVFGEEILGGLDYDGDLAADLFVADLTGDLSPDGLRPRSGVAYVFYGAAGLRGLDLDLDALPPSIVPTVFLGGNTGDIAGDTALHGDFDGDGIADLAFSSPHAKAIGRDDAGILHVFYGQQGRWPSLIDLRPGSLPDSSLVRIAEIYGAQGTSGMDTGDTLAYSAAAGDINRDGRPDLLVNEMLGNGLTAASIDAGNLIILDGRLLLECGDADADGRVAASDLAALRARLADPNGAALTLEGGERCDVAGEDGRCDILDSSVLRRALATPFLRPGIQPVCPAATTP